MAAALYNGLKVLTSYHRKGGVGKTFFASTLAYLLATGGPDKKGKKRRVLILDYDSQQDTSKAFLAMVSIPGEDEYMPPVHPEFGEIDDPDWGGTNTSSDILFDNPVYEYPTAHDNIAILPSEGNVDRVSALSAQADELEVNISRYMRDWFEKSGIHEDYDVVIVDNPPSKTPVSAGLMGAATHVMIPTEVNRDAIDGATLLLDRIDKINDDRDVPLEVVGIFPNMVPSPSRLSVKDKVGLQWLYNPDNRTSNYMADFFIQRRECYRVFERPSMDPSHFSFVHNFHAQAEMNKLYNHVVDSMWGEQ
ncbi:ParA family protein [Neiella marina]|uniref:ParA family protein n=1 Tax=Neiella holothuriorum TaxID=2870530 RepID=A0ABS7EGB8_9GAMM|nr:ParA family protein [Neiella holothuriorum]MBW8191388.1 ParA family protein [Neiella holothuriorum]